MNRPYLLLLLCSSARLVTAGASQVLLACNALTIDIVLASTIYARGRLLMYVAMTCAYIHARTCWLHMRTLPPVKLLVACIGLNHHCACRHYTRARTLVKSFRCDMCYTSQSSLHASPAHAGANILFAYSAVTITGAIAGTIHARGNFFGLGAVKRACNHNYTRRHYLRTRATLSFVDLKFLIHFPRQSPLPSRPAALYLLELPSQVPSIISARDRVALSLLYVTLPRLRGGS